MNAPLEFTATNSLADLMAADTAVAARPLRRRSWRTPLFVLGAMIVGLAAGIQGTDHPERVWRSFLHPREGLFAIAALVSLVGFFVLPKTILTLWAKAIRRGTYVDYRRHHPAVDARDPALRMSRAYRFDETGMTTTTAHDEIWESWSRITGLDETPSLLIVRVGGALNFPLPKAQLPGDLQGRLRAYVDARSTTKWPF